MLRRILKWLAILLAVILLGLFIAAKVMDTPMPTGVKGPAAEKLAAEVLQRINHDSLANTQWISWTFPGNHRYVWHVPSNHAQVSFGSTTVQLNLNTQTGVANRRAATLTGDDLNKALSSAWSFWCNDSWWLIGPHKVNDPGTSRSIVDISADYPGMRGLLVEYGSGGVTPGDSYLWIIDETGLPVGYEMWVNIIPVGGIYASWENYQPLHSEALVSIQHDMGVLKTGLGPLLSGDTYSDIGLTEDIFAGVR